MHIRVVVYTHCLIKVDLELELFDYLFLLEVIYFYLKYNKYMGSSAFNP